MKKQTLSIVAIDDDELDLMILRRHLEKLEGWAVRMTCVTHSEGFPDALTDDAVDLVFLDYRLGRENAPEFLGRCQDLENLRPVVVLTGHDCSDIADSSLRAGASHCLPKQGLNPRILEAVLEQILQPAQ